MTPYALPRDRMAEAEVSLRLAFHLLALPGAEGAADVAIDGAQVKVGRNEIFPISEFLQNEGWEPLDQAGKNPWQGTYGRGSSRLAIHSRSGVGDVVTKVGTQRIRAECKGGPLIKRPGSRDYPILRQALGQVLTVEDVDTNDVLVVAVPGSPRFQVLASKWRAAPLVARCQIQIGLVDRDGTVNGQKLD